MWCFYWVAIQEAQELEEDLELVIDIVKCDSSNANRVVNSSNRLPMKISFLLILTICCLKVMVALVALFLARSIKQHIHLPEVVYLFKIWHLLVWGNPYFLNTQYVFLSFRSTYNLNRFPKGLGRRCQDISDLFLFIVNVVWVRPIRAY